MPAIIDDLLPDYDYRTAHSRWTDAGAEQVWDALMSLRFDELTLTRPLVRVRGLGRRVPDGSVLDNGPVTILRVDEGRQAVGGSISRSWTPRPRRRRLTDADQFLAFGEPGWIKLVTDFRVVPEGSGTRLSTETRVKATDPSARRRFALYWAGIRPFSGVVRRDILAAVVRKATAG
jgi:hypothetical protein